VLDRLWEDSGIKEVLQKWLKKRQFRVSVERAIFAIVANRVLDPTRKRGIQEWVKEGGVIAGLDQIPLRRLCRAMDFLLENGAGLQKRGYCSVANLEVDLLYFETTSTYCEIEDEDGDDGLRRRSGRGGAGPAPMIGPS